jgi:NAD+ kinase
MPVGLMKTAIIYKHKDESARTLAQTMVDYLISKGIDVFCENKAELKGATFLGSSELIESSSLMFLLGGDGTFLHATSLMKTKVIPIVGINMGSLGFLTPFCSEDAIKIIDEAINNKLKIASRFRFDVVLKRDGEITHSYVSANDVVISHVDLARLLEIDCYDNNDHMTTYKADGLILATPAGSTAYALAAGGPILSPDMEAVAMVPICPHQLTQRPIVIPSSSVITIKVNSSGYLTVDGQRGCEVDLEDELFVSRSNLPLQVVLPENYSLFNILRHKLSWGARETENA